MPDFLEEIQPVELGDSAKCGTRGNYRVTREEMEYIKALLEKADGPSPFAIFRLEDIQKTLGGGTSANAHCVSYFLNKKIQADPGLDTYGIFAHSDHGNIRFDKIRPRKEKIAEEATEE